MLPGGRLNGLAEGRIATNRADVGGELTTFGIAINRGLRPSRNDAIIAAERPTGKVAGFKAAIGHQIRRGVHRHIQSGGSAAGVAGRIHGFGGEGVSGIRQGAGRQTPCPAGICIGSADLGRPVEHLHGAVRFRGAGQRQRTRRGQRRRPPCRYPARTT